MDGSLFVGVSNGAHSEPIECPDCERVYHGLERCPNCGATKEEAQKKIEKARADANRGEDAQDTRS